MLHGVAGADLAFGLFGTDRESALNWLLLGLVGVVVVVVVSVVVVAAVVVVRKLSGPVRSVASIFASGFVLLISSAANIRKLKQ